MERREPDPKEELMGTGKDGAEQSRAHKKGGKKTERREVTAYSGKGNRQMNTTQFPIICLMCLCHLAPLHLPLLLHEEG